MPINTNLSISKLIKEKKMGEKAQSNKIRNEKGEVTTEAAAI